MIVDYVLDRLNGADVKTSYLAECLKNYEGADTPMWAEKMKEGLESGDDMLVSLGLIDFLCVKGYSHRYEWMPKIISWHYGEVSDWEPAEIVID